MGLNRQGHYSRSIRQTLYKLHMEGQWRTKYRIFIGEAFEVRAQLGSLRDLQRVGGWGGRSEMEQKDLF